MTNKNNTYFIGCGSDEDRLVINCRTTNGNYTKTVEKNGNREATNTSIHNSIGELENTLKGDKK